MPKHKNLGVVPKTADFFSRKVEDLPLDVARELASCCGRYLRQWQESRKKKELEAKLLVREFELFDREDLA